MPPKSTSDRKDLVVFIIRRDTECGECGDELWHGSFIIVENDEALCLECADLDHLEFLPAGDAALTRRTRKHSRISLVVVQWARARKRYERQGVLAEAEAIAQAERECLADEEVRRRRRERNKLRRARLDAEYVAAFAREIRTLYPGCPEDEARGIAEHACLKHSGRIGRTAAAKAFDAEAIHLAVRAWIRHRHTGYDELFFEGWDRSEAREAVETDVSSAALAWQEPAAEGKAE
jgi:hypothetical protein